MCKILRTCQFFGRSEVWNAPDGQQGVQSGYVFTAVQIQQRLQPRLWTQVGQYEMRYQFQDYRLGFGKHPALCFPE